MYLKLSQSTYSKKIIGRNSRENQGLGVDCWALRTLKINFYGYLFRTRIQKIIEVRKYLPHSGGKMANLDSIPSPFFVHILHTSLNRLLCWKPFEKLKEFEIFLDLFWFFDFSAASNYWSSAGGRELRIRITQSDCQLFPNSADFHCGLWKAKRRISEIRKNENNLGNLKS